MKINVLPGERNEEMIEEIKEARQRLSDEEWEEYCYNLVSEGEEGFDALYYASEECKEALLESWGEKYLEELLQYDKFSYAADMGGFECDIC